MKYFFLLFLIFICALAYVRVEQPAVWNGCLKALRASVGPSSLSGNASQGDSPISDDASFTQPEIISPNSTNHLNPDHVRPVVQPGEVPPPSPTPAAAPTPASATNSASIEVPTSIPSTITTLLGKTYTGCVLSRVTPDGISFAHSMGVAKVPFSDLDPRLAASFGYDPIAAKKYEQDQAIQASESDAERAAITAQLPTPAPNGNTVVAQQSAPPAPQGLSSGQREALQAQMASLQSDISFMQGEEAKLTADGKRLRNSGNDVSHGGYADRIASEQAQVSQLQQQLSR